MKTNIYEHKNLIKMRVSKKAITILTICLLTLAGTQTAQAQTKEETIAWIKEKLEKYGAYYPKDFFTDVKVSPCKVSWTKVHSDGSSGSYSFNPSMAKTWKVDDDGGIYADASIIRNDKYNTWTFYIKPGESDIHERMIKALLHLATFCDEGKNEAF